MRILNSILVLLFVLFAVVGCNAPAQEGNSKLPDISNTDPSNPPGSGNTDQTPPSTGRTYTTQVMLFNGVGISTTDWQSTEAILKKNGFSYQLVNSTQLNAMTEDDIAKFGTMVFPGGYGNQITDGLTSQARINVRNAVINRGVGYVGFCAGAWTAVGPTPAAGKAASYGFAIVPGDGLLDEFLPGGYEPAAAMVKVDFPNGSSRQMIWVGGPIVPSWKGGVIAKYNETGEAAIAETWAGKGLVLITGPHPEAPASWVPGYGLSDSDGVDHQTAVDLFNAAINQQPLAAF